MIKQLTLLVLVLSFSFVSLSIVDYYVKCEDKKPKLGVCALTDYESNKIIVKKSCGKDQQCYSPDETRFFCYDKPKPNKIGKGCSYDGDCASYYCNSGKCDGLAEGGDCSYKGCNHESACSDEEEKCVKLVGEGEYCKKNEIRCQFGLKCDQVEGLRDDNNKVLNSTCRKLGSIDDGGYSNDPVLCKSGMAYGGKCVSVEKEGKCADGTYYDEWGRYYSYINCTDLELKGNTYDGKALCESFYFGEEPTYRCPYVKVKTELWKKYMEEFNNVDLDKIKKDENALYENDGYFQFTFNKPKLSKLDILYYRAPEFLERGFIGDDGEVKDDYKCEVDFLLNYENSNSIKFSYFLLALLVGLFI